MLTVTIILVVVAFVCAVLSKARPAWDTLWLAVLLLAIVGLLQVLPKG